ncbi:MFS transporter [Microbacterium sp. Bi128]|uniref:MFS transporter n=1 Tax=Microbacterium sp. Bi128 TaxID=2821115 RepID=UPI001D5EBDE6|nr:MFS transporter [Microbacterium sp. Bi128]CAH0133083.1 Multidrug resistance protein MdtH [Microbacterium sp. Bi128]
MPNPPARTPVLLGTQLLFNVGFYAVVPFLALVLTEDFGLAAVAVGLVLGVRTFMQQGMFLVGGVLADRFGPRRVILFGCAVRIAGFATLAGSLLTPAPTLALFVLGTVLTGLGGALFSPGLNILLAEAEARRPAPGPRSRASLFAWLSVTGELGAVIGPLVGAALLGWGFVVVALGGAAFFLAIGVFLAVALPRTLADRSVDRPPGRWWSLRDRRFVGFSALHAADLLAYNQLYLALPLQLARVPDAAAATAAMFAGVSVLTLTLQLPVSRWAARVGPAVALRVGYVLSGAGFAVLAVAAAFPLDDAARVATVFAAAALVILGHMATHPTALTLAPRFAAGRPTGSFFGLLATCGGIAVLLGNLVVGALFAWTAVPSAAWLFLAVPLVAAAALAPRLLPRTLDQAPVSNATRATR